MRIKTVKVDEAKLFKLMAKNNVENLHQLGKLSGVSHDTVNRIFRENNSYTTLPTATCIAYALGVKVTDFIVLNDPKPEPIIVPESEKKMGGWTTNRPFVSSSFSKKSSRCGKISILSRKGRSMPRMRRIACWSVS